jgi:hypothetical protein
MKLPKRIAGKPFKAQQRSLKQENELAKRFKGRTTRGSGRGNEKGDVRLNGIARIEAKTTSKASFQLKKTIFNQLETAATATGEVPVVVVEFLNNAGKPTHELAVIPMWALNSLLSK